MEERQKLTQFDATMLVMGGIIGVGIFFTPPAIAELIPTPGPYFLIWGLGGLAALAGAMTFAELAATFPRSGGWFVFLREAFGPLPAFLFAWVVLFVISTGAAAVVAEFCARQIGILAWGERGAPEAATRAIGAAILVGVTALAFTGLKRGAIFQNACMVLKLLAIGAFAVAGVALFDPGSAVPAAATAADAAPSLAEGMMRAALPVLFAYGGWQYVTYIAPHIVNPQRTLPRSILIGVIGVVVVYLAANFAYVHVLGMDGLAHTEDFAAEMARRTFGDVGGTVLVAAMAISSLGVCTAILISTPGVYVAMAKEGLFFETFGRLHPRTGAPVAALALQLTIALGYYAWGRAGTLVDAVVFAEWIFHALVGLALLKLRRLRPELPRPFKSWAYPLFPALYVLLACAVVVGSLITAERDRTLLGLSVLAVGLAVYAPWRRVMAQYVRNES